MSEKRQTTSLYNVPRTEEGTWVRVVEAEDGPPAGLGFEAGQEILYYHTDGMYSYCKDKDGNVCHLKAWAEVEVL